MGLAAGTTRPLRGDQKDLTMIVHISPDPKYTECSYIGQDIYFWARVCLNLVGVLITEWE